MAYDLDTVERMRSALANVEYQEITCLVVEALW